MFEYQAFECDADEIHARLSNLAGQDFRLHTCHPMTIRGSAHVDSVRYAVVMEKFIPDPEPEAEESSENAMAMR